MAVAGEVDLAPLRAAGWALRGVLSAMPYADLRDATTYPTAQDLARDDRIDAVAVDGADPSLVAVLPELRRAGLLVLLPDAAPLEPDAVRSIRAVPDAGDAVVGLLRRYDPWARTVASALPLVGAPPVQVTVRGWPRGQAQAAELVDLVSSWCGEVAAVVASPAPLPAERLPDGEQVSWALLTAGGATVLVSHEGVATGGSGPLVRLSFATARLEAGPSGVRWQGGADLPLASPLEARTELAAALLRAVGGRDVPTTDWPWPADLSDLSVAARVLEALRTSARTEALVPVA